MIIDNEGNKITVELDDIKIDEPVIQSTELGIVENILKYINDIDLLQDNPKIRNAIKESAQKLITESIFNVEEE